MTPRCPNGRLLVAATALLVLGSSAIGCSTSSEPSTLAGVDAAEDGGPIGAPDAGPISAGDTQPRDNDSSVGGPVADAAGADATTSGDPGVTDAAATDGATTTTPTEDAADGEEAGAPEDIDEPDDASGAGDADAGGPTPCPAGETRCEVQDVQVCTAAGDWLTVATCQEATPCWDGACCTPSCDPLAECGSDGCGGSCGECPAGEGCVLGACECAPDCDGKDCGDDSCGGSCGECSEGDACLDGVCTCTPECGGAVCGGDGCGGSCGECPADNECIEGTCVGPCAPGSTRCADQDVEVCGPDGESWIKVASCPGTNPCFEGACCTPECLPGVECGGDGCGGSCGTCAQGLVCVDSECLCVPTCEDAECGDDGCGGSCGDCDDPGDSCVDGSCSCAPDCASAVCGDDGCGSTCGTCGDGTACVGGLCLEPCTPGETLCDGASVLICDESGEKVLLTDCASTDQACEQGACVDLPSPEVCTGVSMEAAQCALDLYNSPSVLGIEVWSPSGANHALAYTAIEHYGAADNGLETKAPPSYLLISTGAWTDLTHQSDLGGGDVVDPFDPGGAGAYDVFELILQLKAPAGATGFAFDSLFMSVEYEEWIGSSFSDKFYAVLQAPSTTGGLLQVINSGPCSNPDAWSDYQVGDNDFCFVSINSGFSESCAEPATDISGTGYDCASGGSSTGWLSTAWPIVAGEELTLTFHIHDGADSAYDSAALIDNFRWLDESFAPGTVSLTEEPPCEPQCEAKACGNDQCGGTCGECAEAEYCSVDGQCIAPAEDAIVLHVVWDTPLDPNQTDEGPDAGADMDLHFTHPNASWADIDEDGTPEPWFDQVWDCFWFNPAPEWVLGDPAADDDPSLDLDDTDGAGPEIVSLGVPEDGTTYRIGVHYWNDHDFGMSAASVKIFLYGDLVTTIGPVDLVDSDMWDVATIQWPSGVITPVVDDDGQPAITPGYDDPLFFVP